MALCCTAGSGPFSRIPAGQQCQLSYPIIQTGTSPHGWMPECTAAGIRVPDARTLRIRRHAAAIKVYHRNRLTSHIMLVGSDASLLYARSPL